MAPRFSKQEMEDFVEILSTDDPAAAEYAVSSLLIASPRQKLSLLLKALPKSVDVKAQRICFILGSIPDERCIDPLLSVLQRKNPNTRIAAIDALKFFPGQRALSHLIEQLRFKDEEVQKKVIEALGTYIKRGISEAQGPLLQIVKDENQSIDVRRSALKGLENLETDEFLPILKDLENNSSAEIYAEVLYALEILETGDKEKKRDQVHQLITNMLSEENILKKMFWSDKIVETGRLGAEVLMERLLKSPKNFELLSSANQIFEQLGLNCVPVFKKVFNSFDQFDNFERVHLLSEFVWAAKEVKMTPLASTLVNYYRRMNAYLEEKSKSPSTFYLYKAEILLTLADFGVKDILGDLKTLFDDGNNLGFAYLLEAIYQIGDKDFLLPLINLYGLTAQERGDRSKTKRVFRAIAKREGIKRDDPLFKDLPQSKIKDLESLFSTKRRRRNPDAPPF